LKVNSTGEVLVVGNDTAKLYNPNTHQSRPTGTPRSPRFKHAATWLQASVYMPRKNHTATLLSSGQVLVTGGAFYPFSDPQDAQLYNPATNTWTAAGAMSRGCGSHLALQLLSGSVMVLGGGYDVVDLYDPYTRRLLRG